MSNIQIIGELEGVICYIQGVLENEVFFLRGSLTSLLFLQIYLRFWFSFQR